MQIQVTKDERVTRVRIVGDMTIYNAAEIKQQLLMSVAECAAVVINLADVAEIDSAGFQQLYLAKREALRAGKPLHLTEHSAAIREVIALYHMESYFGDPVGIPGVSAPHDAGAAL
ncbi:MAG: STAS domain-containing protein [Gammaproteobacteria bacterium]